MRTFNDLKKGDKIIFDSTFQNEYVFIGFKDEDFGKMAEFVNDNLEFETFAAKTEIDNKDRWYDIKVWKKLTS